jgi:hypothetical protein
LDTGFPRRPLLGFSVNRANLALVGASSSSTLTAYFNIGTIFARDSTMCHSSLVCFDSPARR